jgi:hypothetical protein
VRIDAPAGPGREDWRADHDRLTHTKIDIPDAVASGMSEVMRHFGLVYRAWDFAVRPDGRWFALEVNPNGQWAWDHPHRNNIADALADELMRGETT